MANFVGSGKASPEEILAVTSSTLEQLESGLDEVEKQSRQPALPSGT